MTGTDVVTPHGGTSPHWRAYIGDWDDGPDDSDRWPVLDARRLTWDAARDALRAELAKSEDSDCPHCSKAAQNGLARLDALNPGTSFECSVDWDEYVLMQDGGAA